MFIPLHFTLPVRSYTATLTCMSSCIRQRFSFTNNASSDPQHNISIGCVFLTLGNFVNWVTAVRYALEANTLKLNIWIVYERLGASTAGLPL